MNTSSFDSDENIVHHIVHDLNGLGLIVNFSEQFLFTAFADLTRSGVSVKILLHEMLTRVYWLRPNLDPGRKATGARRLSVSSRQTGEQAAHYNTVSGAAKVQPGSVQSVGEVSKAASV